MIKVLLLIHQSRLHLLLNLERCIKDLRQDMQKYAFFDIHLFSGIKTIKTFGLNLPEIYTFTQITISY